MKKILAVTIGSIGILLVILGIIAKTRKAFSVSDTGKQFERNVFHSGFLPFSASDNSVLYGKTRKE